MRLGCGQLDEAKRLRGHPAIARVLAGIRRRYGTRQAAKTAILAEGWRRMVAQADRRRARRRGRGAS
jgi:hypothetical protein